jgi:Macrocin-O-methyltransferase (TylF)
MTNSSKAVLISIDRHNIRSDQGYCYTYDLPLDAPLGDREHDPYSSAATLFEDGVALGPTHVPHDIIRSQGGGRFSHWNRQLFFSTSDNTEPHLNRRDYQLYVPGAMDSDPEWSLINRVRTEPLGVPLQERFDVARRAFRRIWGNMPLPDHGRQVEHDDEFAREFARLSPESDVTAERKFNLNQLFRLVYSVAGDVAECGTYKGASAFFLARHIQHATLNKKLLLFDSFEGLSQPESIDQSYWKMGDLTSHFNEVSNALAPLGPTSFLEVYKGWIPTRFAEVADRRFCFVHIDVDLYRSTLDSIDFFYPRMSPRGVILLDDYGFASCPGVTRAVDEFMAGKPEPIINLASGGAFIMRDEK